MLGMKGFRLSPQKLQNPVCYSIKVTLANYYCSEVFDIIAVVKGCVAIQLTQKADDSH